MNPHNPLSEFETMFIQALRSLNPAQKKAVDAIDGPVMVIAGPGTGKTEILTLRIANILRKTDTRPENILALTFTESGASAMRERLLRYIGSDAYRVGIFTFHAFAQQLISQYPDAYMRIIGGRPATDLEKLSFIETILNGGPVKILRPAGDPRYYVFAIEQMIGSLKQEYITPDGLSSIINKQEEELRQMEKTHQKGPHKGKVRSDYQKKEKSIEKNRELLHVYVRYEALMRDAKFYDFNDMIIETIAALESNEDMLRDLQEQYQYILADEHQDVNGSQNRILELLATFHEHPNIFVVGDEKQAIYRFQGASLENFLYFEDSFAGTKSISLVSNYRSGQRILDAAHSLIFVENGPSASLRVPLVSERVSSSEAELRSFPHELYEDQWLIAKIKALIENGTTPESIAVITRTNREVEALTVLLRKEGIEADATAESDILKHPITLSIQSLLSALFEAGSEDALFEVLHGPYWGISSGDLLKVLSSRSYDRPLGLMLRDSGLLKEIGVQEPKKLMRVIEVLENTRVRAVSNSPQSVLEYLLQESGFLSAVLAENSIEATRVVRRLYDEIEAMVLQDHASRIQDVQRILSLRTQYGLPLQAPFISVHAHAVQVMTAHRSKGLEFGTVFIPHLVDSMWGNRKTRKYFDIPLQRHLSADALDAQDDERRLLYVAMTRAQHDLYLSYAHTNTEGRAFVPSRLLSEIDRSFLIERPTKSEMSAFGILDPLTKKEPSFRVDTSFLERMLSERGISATSLNNYLESPWDYLYTNVLRIPQVQTESLQFGTVVHGVLQRIAAYHNAQGEMPRPALIKEYLEHALGRLPITNEQYARLHEKGFAALVAYAQQNEAQFPRATKEEFSIKVEMPTGIPEFPLLRLTGKLDRLDMNENGEVVQVVDYKTGKPKSRNFIEGNTKGSTGNYKRQLTFYALLLSLYGDDRFACKTGLLSFVEPDSKNAIHEELFTITDAEIDALKAELVGIAKEILSGSFLSEAYAGENERYAYLSSLLQDRDRDAIKD